MSQQVSNQPELPVYHFQFEFSADRPLQLPDYPGSAWRGAFGHALKRTVCVVRNTACSECMLQYNCAYSYIFETPTPHNSQKMRKYTATPHPFVLQFPTDNQAGAYRLELILFGKAQAYLPYIIHALQKAGRDGIGKNRQPFELQLVRQITQTGGQHIIYQDTKLLPLPPEIPLNIPPLPKTIKMTINTPMRIKQNGHYLNPETFNFCGLFSNLIRRISMLMYFHTEVALETDFAALTQQARQIPLLQQNLSWFDWKRYSSRQKTRMNMGGVTGTVDLDLSQHPEYWPYLWLGQWTHVGKATSMGLGHYSLTSLSASQKEYR